MQTMKSTDATNSFIGRNTIIKKSRWYQRPCRRPVLLGFFRVMSKLTRAIYHAEAFRSLQRNTAGSLLHTA